MNRSNVGTRKSRVYTEEMQKWILDNANLGIFRNQKHFTDVFNAIHGTAISYQAMNTHLFRYGIVVKTKNNTSVYTEDMNNWLIINYSKYNNNWVSLTSDFNLEFGTDFSATRLCKHCERKLKIHKPKKKIGHVNNGTFKKGVRGTATDRQAPIGTIRTYSSGTLKMLYIKVKLTDGDSGMLCKYNCGHNYKRPWWIPLKEKIWIDTYGEIPEGYSVIQLDRNYQNCELDNLVLADKRGLAIMGSHKWWSDNRTFNATGIQWCNLYMTAKDNGVMG